MYAMYKMFNSCQKSIVIEVIARFGKIMKFPFYRQFSISNDYSKYYLETEIAYTLADMNCLSTNLSPYVKRHLN